MALVPYKELRYDWSKASDRRRFEEKLQEWRKERKSWSTSEKFWWFCRLILFQFMFVLLLYGSICYVILT